MKPVRWLWVLAAAVVAGTAASVGGQQGDFSWEIAGEKKVGELQVVTLKVRSQVWRGIPWEHQVEVYLPPKITHPGTGMMLITGGNPNAANTLLGSTLATRFEAPSAVLYNIPNQPLFDGKVEDDLIAHTFQQYLATGESEWPLLKPMVTSARRAMDALQEWSRRHRPAAIERFVLTGASKRGWTTYLTGASDRRVAGIAPMVFDNLNFDRQLPRQLELWGRYSEQIDDYTRRGLQKQLETPRGKDLVRMVDPWFHRDRLTMPKLLIHGANDRYWATDATRIYWDELKGDRYLLTVPNAGHGLEDRNRVINSLSAFFHAVAAGKKLPTLREEYRNEGGQVRFRLQASTRPAASRLWVARAPDTEFRPVRWEASPLPENGEWHALPTHGGGLAVFPEAEFELDGRRFSLTLPPRVFDLRKP